MTTETTNTTETTETTTEPTNRAAWIEWRAAQLVAAGGRRENAERRAAHEWRARSPQHAAAIARRAAMASDRRNMTTI